MCSKISFSINNIAQEELLNFLNEVNEDTSFIGQHLAERVNISEYCNKIYNNAFLFTANHEDELVGIIAIYLNDENKKAGYITLVHIKRGFRNMGIASSLLKDIILFSLKKDFKYIDLEVSIDNINAIYLYKKHGFVPIQKKGKSFIMRYTF